MRFLVDEQLPAAIAHWLVGVGHDAEHVRTIDMKAASDQAIWDHALATRSVIVTKDRDFIEWAVARSPAPAVLWLRFGNLSRSILLTRLDAAWPQITARFEAGAMVVEAGP